MVVVAAVASLAACGQQGGKQANPPPNDGPVITPPAENRAESAPSGPGGLPPQTEAPRFVGRWAADLRSCQNKAWNFTATTLDTPAGAHCSFRQVTQVPGGYDIQASCTAEGPLREDTLTLRFAESAQAMLLESESIAGSGLVFCGRPA